MAFSVKNAGAVLARELAERLQVVSYAVSLGKTKSLLFYIPTDDILRSSFRLEGKEAQNYRDWAADGVFRFSVGLEDPEDIIADLAQAMG
jgi:cystathionine gamma-synthase